MTEKNIVIILVTTMWKFGHWIGPTGFGLHLSMWLLLIGLHGYDINDSWYHLGWFHFKEAIDCRLSRV